MPKAGRLTITLTSAQADSDRVQGKPGVSPGPFVCLTVSDTGAGMDAATLKRVFEPFFTTKAVGSGTGMGLATVQGIVAQHKGWVEVYSKPDKGTTFKVFLPATNKSLVEPIRARRPASLPGTETVLLVEDEDGLRRLVARVLRGLGYQVIEADNGHAALRAWQQHPGTIDLLFSDMTMPGGLTGLDLAAQLRIQQPALKVIISSGYSPQTPGIAKLEFNRDHLPPKTLRARRPRPGRPAMPGPRLRLPARWCACLVGPHKTSRLAVGNGEQCRASGSQLRATLAPLPKPPTLRRPSAPSSDTVPA